MEAKLKEYRALRRRQQLMDEAKEKLEYTKQKVINFITPKVLKNMGKEKDEDELLLIEPEEVLPRQVLPRQVLPRQVLPRHISPVEIKEPVEEASEASELEAIEEENQESWKYFIIKWSIYSMTWITLYIFFIKVGFGAVFFAMSLLIGLCINTRTRKKQRGEVSAYSVFNENCTSIDGTVTAEQLQREMMFGSFRI